MNCLFTFLICTGLICTDQECPDHHQAMRLREDNSVIDLWSWCCQTPNCKKKLSIRKCSFFSDSKLTLKAILSIVYHWFFRCPQKLAGFEAGLSNYTEKCGNKTVIDMYNFFRDVCRESLITDGEQIGGPGKIVKIDESAFGKRKYNRGSRRNTYWVFGGVERDSNNGFLVAVKKRNKPLLWPLIVKYIRLGTTKISDGWKAYIGLDTINNYKHQVVNHSLNFKDPDTGAHTNTCEGSWLHAKRNLRTFGTRKTMLGNYFAVRESASFEIINYHRTKKNFFSLTQVLEWTIEWLENIFGAHGKSLQS